MLVALAARLAGIASGLPFAYNPDEELHFVPAAAAAADGDLNPGYFQNPSALTYLLAVVFRVVFIGRDVTELLDSDPGAVFLVARLVVAVLGAVSVLVLYRVGRRYFGTGAGLVAAALIGFAFLPLHYSRQALNDLPTLLAVACALGAVAWVHERGRWRDVLLAGGWVGVATATKYTAAPLGLVVAVALLARVLAGQEGWWRGLVKLVAAGLACVAVFVVLNPYLLVDLDLARSQLGGQSAQAASGKLGQAGAAWSAYPESLLWGFGVLPVVFAVVGVVLAVRGGGTQRVRVLLLVVFPVLLYLYLSTQDRFFARWMLPVYPALAILAGHGVARVAGWVRDRVQAGRGGPGRGGRVWGVAAAGLVCGLVLAQPVADAVRNVVVVSHADTRTLALAWLEDTLQPGDGIVVEPSVPDDYLADLPVRTYPVERPYQDYEPNLEPSLVDEYRADGYCWVLVNSFQRDRGLAAGLPGARAYYERLEREADAVTVFSPYREGAEAPAFSYDTTFNWYPLAYERPGPYLQVVHLGGCR